MTKTRKTYTPQQKQEVLNRIKNGENYKAVAKDCGISVTSVYYWMTKAKAMKASKKSLTVKTAAASKPTSRADQLIANFAKELKLIWQEELLAKVNA